MINVLIIEDDPMVAQLNRRYVNSLEGFNVSGHAVNGQDALKYCNENLVDLIILDIYMPKLDGLEFLKLLKKDHTYIDVIFVTASNETEMIKTALNLGAVDYLVKPFEYNRFRQALLKYLERKKLLTSEENINQILIDKIINGDEEVKSSTLSKGLHKNTLDRILRYLEKNEQPIYTSDQLSKDLDVSKVTIRRYMDYFESIGKVHMEIQYGTIGRPSYLYTYIKNDN